MKLTKLQRHALQAVEAGAVFHVHPFTWTSHLDSEGKHPNVRVLQRLANLKLIKVAANSPKYLRPVILTDAGRNALSSLWGG